MPVCWKEHFWRAWSAGCPSLSPLKLRVPDGPLYFLAGSIGETSSRIFSSSLTMQCTRSAYLESIVLGLEDLSTFSLGWTNLDGRPLSSRPFATTAVAAIPDSVVNQFFGGERHFLCMVPSTGVYP